MKKKFIKTSLIVIIIVLVMLSTILIIASDKSPFSTIGDYAKIFFNDKKENSKVMARVNGLPIMEEEIGLIKQSYEAFGQDVTTEALVKRQAIDLLLVEEALQNNISVSLETAEEKARFEINKLKENKVEKQRFTDYINAAGLSEDDYIEIALPIYQKALTIGEYKYKILKPQFIEANPNLSDWELQNEFEAFYTNYKEELYKNSDVEIIG